MWNKSLLVSEGVSHVMTFDLDLYTFTPIAESGQFRPLRLGRGEGRVDHIL